MILQIKELQQFLLSITKHKINRIYIKSKNSQIIVNTVKNKNNILIQNKKSYKKIETDHVINNIKNNSLKEKKNLKNEEKSTYFTIVSPMIGTFYRSPAPHESPYIRINDFVKINQTVCIIEAMKLMNEIESEVNGNIVEILVDDGDIVDCGQALMRVKKE